MIDKNKKCLKTYENFFQNYFANSKFCLNFALAFENKANEHWKIYNRDEVVQEQLKL